MRICNCKTPCGYFIQSGEEVCPFIGKPVSEYSKCSTCADSIVQNNLETDNVGIKRMVEANRNVFAPKTLKTFILCLVRLSKVVDLNDSVAVEKTIDSYRTLYKRIYRRAYELYLKANRNVKK